MIFHVFIHNLICNHIRNYDSGYLKFLSYVLTVMFFSFENLTVNVYCVYILKYFVVTKSITLSYHPKGMPILMLGKIKIINS